MGVSTLVERERSRQLGAITQTRQNFAGPISWAEGVVKDLIAEGWKAELVINPNSYQPAVFELGPKDLVGGPVPYATIFIDAENNPEMKVDLFGPSTKPRYGMAIRSERTFTGEIEAMSNKGMALIAILAHEVRLKIQLFHTQEEIESRLADRIASTVEVSGSTKSLENKAATALGNTGPSLISAKELQPQLEAGSKK